MTKMVIGLGNPGPRYAATRHNVGFRVVEELERRQGLQARRGRSAIVVRGAVAGQPVLLVCPTTFMNESGRAVRPLLRRHGVKDLADVLVVLDDMDLPVGALRLRIGGSDGGHNGMRSIIAAVATQDFPRLRLGVGRPPPGWDPIDHVLTPFARDEQPVIGAAVQAAADAVECWIEEGVTEAMNRFNSWRPAEADEA